MSDGLKIETRVRRLSHYITDIETGLIQIPAFQRDFIWQPKAKLELLDSLKRSYPIGSILFWKPVANKIHISEEMSIGAFSTPEPSDNSSFFYILDGFQRLSTIAGCLINPDKSALVCNETERKTFAIYYDLKEEEFFFPRSKKIEPYQVAVHQLLDTRAAFSFERKLTAYSESEVILYMDRYIELGTTLIDYSLPSIDMIGGDIEEVVEIFSRVNSKGSPISSDWMASALTYNNEKGFRLGSEIDDLLNELNIYNFSELNRNLIIQCISSSFGKIYFDTNIEHLIKTKGDNFRVVAIQTIANIKRAVKFLFEELLVVNTKLLPYSIQLVFITHFFNQISKPTEVQLKKLKEWFWITSYANYFTLYSLSKQRKAYEQFQIFLKDERQPAVYNDKPNLQFEALDFPNKISFGSVRSKALVLFMLNYFNDFKSIDSTVIEGLKLNYLFYNSKKPESAVAILEPSNFKKAKDMSFMIGSQENYDAYFITQEMKDIYADDQDNRQDKILKLRKEVLVLKEQKFIKSLDLQTV